MRNKRIGKSAILACLILMAAVFAAMPAMAKTTHKLLKSCTNESYDYTKKAWTKAFDIRSFKYDKKGHIKKVTRKIVENGELINTKVRNIKNKYKKGKLIKRTENDKVNCVTFITSFKKGVPVNTYCDNDGYVSTHKYKYKGRYAVSDIITSYGPDADDKIVHTQKYKVKIKKGYPVRITSTEPVEGGTRSTVVTFNKSGKAKGLVKSVVCNTPDFRSTYSFKYKFKKSRVSVATKTNTDFDKSDSKTYTYKERYKFSYAKKTIGAKRYGSMINGNVIGMLGPDELYGTSLEDFYVTYWF